MELAFNRFKQLADKKREIYDEDIESIVVEEILRMPRRFKLVYLNVIAGNITVPTATVKMEVDGKLIQEAGFGDGPVDATFKTIKKITRTRAKLLQFAINAITGGTEAQGEVTVRLEEKGQTVIGQGADTDVIVASAKAYINALNKIEFKKQKLVGISNGQTSSDDDYRKDTGLACQAKRGHPWRSHRCPGRSGPRK